MKYSVLMSVYKSDNPDYLKSALLSTYEYQTKKPDEIVIVFDGELTQELHLVLNKFADDKPEIVKYIQLPENFGLGEALRVGSEACTGDYIFRMDADDINDSSRFEKQISYLEAHPEVDVLGTDISEFYNSPSEGNLRVRACPKSQCNIVRMAKHRNPMNHVSVCIRKSAMAMCGGYKTLLLLEDYYLWLRMIVNKCVFANISESLVYVRIGNGFYARRRAKVRIDGWRILQEYMLANGLINKFEAKMNMIYIYLFTYLPKKMIRLAYDKFLRK